MKKLFIFLIIGLISFQLNAQDIFNPTSNLSDADKTAIADAKKKLDRAVRMMANADNDYKKFENLFTHKSKRKQKKAEKKTVTAKRNILSAANYYNKGYSVLYELYIDKLSTLIFNFQDDRTKADDLILEAGKLFTTGQTLLTKNGSYTDKELEKVVKFKSLENEVIRGANKQKDAILKLIEAISIHENQGQKQQQFNEKDNRAWQNALMQNSIDGYERYLADFPNGLHISEAQKKIEELEEKIRIAELQQQNPELVYHIQIMADKHSWSIADIKSKIFNTSDAIIENHFDGWYKYWIGNFTSYDEAKIKKQQIQRKRRGIFIVATVNGNPVDILQALNVESSNNN